MVQPFWPNTDEGFNNNQSEVDEKDAEILLAGIKGDGVISGCAVTAQTPADMSIHVAAGVVQIGGVQANVAAADPAVGAADGSDPRFDLVVIDNAGTVSVVAGTPGSTTPAPKFPDIPADSIVAAAVYVPASDTDIDAEQIADKRVFVRDTTSANRIDISDDTNAAASSPVTLVGDTFGLDQSAISHDSIGDVSEDDHHIAFVGLEDNAGASIDPAADNRIQLTDDGVVNADKSGDNLALSIAQGQIDHGSIGGLTDADHPASAITPDTGGFDGVLSAADDTVQKALNTLDDITTGPTLYVETLAEILAETPGAGDLALATDTGYFLIHDGSDWQESGVKFNVRSSLDMGAELDSSQEGYHTDYLTDKSLFNVRLLANALMTLNGHLRLDTTVSPMRFEVVADDVVQDIPLDIAYLEQDYTHTPAGEKISIRSGNSQALGLNGLPVVREYQTDMGAYPSPVYVDGGAF